MGASAFHGHGAHRGCTYAAYLQGKHAERQRQQSVPGLASSLFPDTSNRDVGKQHKKKIDERVARIRYSSSAGQPGTKRHVITLANRCVCLVYAEHPIFRKSRQKRKTTNPQAFQRHGPVLQTLYTFVLMLWHQASTAVVIFQGSWLVPVGERERAPFFPEAERPFSKRTCPCFISSFMASAIISF